MLQVSKPRKPFIFTSRAAHPHPTFHLFSRPFPQGYQQRGADAPQRTEGSSPRRHKGPQGTGHFTVRPTASLPCPSLAALWFSLETPSSVAVGHIGPIGRIGRAAPPLTATAALRFAPCRSPKVLTRRPVGGAPVSPESPAPPAEASLLFHRASWHVHRTCLRVQGVSPPAGAWGSAPQPFNQLISQSPNQPLPLCVLCVLCDL